MIQQRFIVGALLMLALIAGCPLRPADDALEPNDTAEQATPISLGQTVSARAVQNNPDLFSVIVPPATPSTPTGSLEFVIEPRGGVDCPSFVVTGPDGTLLYQDTNYYCGRQYSPPVTVDGASLTIQPGIAYRVRVPVTTPGAYLLTINERGEVDNVFDYYWDYQLTANLAD